MTSIGSNPASLVAASTGLFDDLVMNAPDFCMYAPVSARDMHCSVAFTRILRAVNAEVRTHCPVRAIDATGGVTFRWRALPAVEEPALQFYPETMPATERIDFGALSRGGPGVGTSK